MIERLLSILFPPKMPTIQHLHERVSGFKHQVDENDAFTDCGIVSVREKQYKNGIERFFADRTIHI